MAQQEMAALANYMAQAMQDAKRMKRYHYVTVRAEALASLSQIISEPDAYVADCDLAKEVRGMLQKGYRWIRTDGGWAVFEKQVS